MSFSSKYSVTNCYYCNSAMNENEILDWESVAMCCLDHYCGCNGRPTEPPYCSNCINKFNFETTLLKVF